MSPLGRESLRSLFGRTCGTGCSAALSRDGPQRETYTLAIEYNNFQRGGVKPTIEGSALQPVFTQLTTGARFAEKHDHTQQGDFPTQQEALRSHSKASCSWIRPRLMRGYSHPLERQLRPDGANVSSVLREVMAGPEQHAVLHFVRALPEREITGIDFLETPRGEVMVQVEETLAGSPWREAAVLSDGTLRVLAIVAALLSAEPGTTVIIEEIDNGLHPPRIGRILELVREFAERRQLQVLVTTHNPALLDSVPIPRYSTS